MCACEREYVCFLMWNGGLSSSGNDSLLFLPPALTVRPFASFSSFDARLSVIVTHRVRICCQKSFRLIFPFLLSLVNITQDVRSVTKNTPPFSHFKLKFSLPLRKLKKNLFFHRFDVPIYIFYHSKIVHFLPHFKIFAFYKTVLVFLLVK